MKKIIVAFVLTGMLLNSVDVVFADDKDICREQIIERIGCLQNIVVEYKEIENFTPPKALLALQELKNKEDGSKRFVITTGKYEHQIKYTFLEGKAHYYKNLLKYPARVDEELFNRYVYEEYIYKGDASERLVKGNKDSTHHGTIGNMIPPEYDIELALGIKETDNGWLSLDKLKNCEVEIEGSRYVKLAKVDSKGIKHEWSFDKNYGLALTSYRTYIPPENHLNVDIKMESIESVDGLFLPTKVTSRLLYWDEGEYKVAKESLLYDIKYKINDSSNTEESYKIKWPDGTIIIDQKTGSPTFIKKPETKNDPNEKQ